MKGSEIIHPATSIADFARLSIASDKKLIDALKKMDALERKLLIVIENKKYRGLVSAGDIQRAIIKNRSLETCISQVLRKNIRIGRPQDSFDTVKKMMLDYRMEFCPVVNGTNDVVKIYFWEDLFLDSKVTPVRKFDLPIVVMAGCFGTRLRPLTRVLPKPLIPIGEKTMLEEIFDRFGRHGCNQFYISVNYKAELIEFYLKNENLPYELNFVREEKPMGTAGSLSLLKGKITQTFFVNNCDILIEADLAAGAVPRVTTKLLLHFAYDPRTRGQTFRMTSRCDCESIYDGCGHPPAVLDILARIAADENPAEPAHAGSPQLGRVSMKTSERLAAVRYAP